MDIPSVRIVDNPNVSGDKLPKENTSQSLKQQFERWRSGKAVSRSKGWKGINGLRGETGLSGTAEICMPTGGVNAKTRSKLSVEIFAITFMKGMRWMPPEYG